MCPRTPAARHPETRFSPPASSEPLLQRTTRQREKRPRGRGARSCSTGRDDAVHLPGLSVAQVEVGPGRLQLLVKAGHHRHVVDLLGAHALRTHSHRSGNRRCRPAVEHVRFFSPHLLFSKVAFDQRTHHLLRGASRADVRKDKLPVGLLCVADPT